MAYKISKAEHAKMQNPFIQFFKYIYLSIKIMFVVAAGHGGTRN
ncbi:hypothetical protein [Lacihabitans sp. LS3-19]|nr:hypothetical protein [Lacihabitans sp. LS3-19]